MVNRLVKTGELTCLTNDLYVPGLKVSVAGLFPIGDLFRQEFMRRVRLPSRGIDIIRRRLEGLVIFKRLCRIILLG